MRHLAYKKWSFVGVREEVEINRKTAAIIPGSTAAATQTAHCQRRCKIPHYRRDKFPHPTTFMQPCEGSGNAEDGGTSRDTRSIQSRTEQKSDCPKCQRRRNFVHFRRSKSVHLLTPSRTQLRGAAIVHCGGIPHDPRLASSGAEHQPDLPGDGISSKHSAKTSCCPNHANTGFPQDTAEQT